MLELPDDARLVLCDVWGVLHDGFPAFPGALAALARWRREGRTIVLVSNSPRPSSVIARQLAQLDLPDDLYDALVTSGDAGIAYVADRPFAFIGTASDREALAEGGLSPSGGGGERLVVCMGFDEERAEPAAYDEELAAMRARSALLVCFNPDRVVHHRGRRELCAGTIADRYTAMGGEVVFTGKPFAPIYDRAFAVASEVTGRTFERRETVAIGDGLATDAAGAAEYGVRFIFVTGGIERETVARDGVLTAIQNAGLSDGGSGFAPIAAVQQLT